MTADFNQFDMKFLGETATRIINEVKGVNRVIYENRRVPRGIVLLPRNVQSKSARERISGFR